MKQVITFCKRNIRLCLSIVLTISLLLFLYFLIGKIFESKIGSASLEIKLRSISVFIFLIVFLSLVINLKKRFISDNLFEITKHSTLLSSVISIVMFYLFLLIGLSLTTCVYLLLQKFIGASYLIKHFNITLTVYLVSSLPYIISMCIYNYSYDHILLKKQLKLINQEYIMFSVYKSKPLIPIVGLLLLTVNLIGLVLISKSFYGLLFIFIISIVYFYWSLISTENYVSLIEHGNKKTNT